MYELSARAFVGVIDVTAHVRTLIGAQDGQNTETAFADELVPSAVSALELIAEQLDAIQAPIARTAALRALKSVTATEKSVTFGDFGRALDEMLSRLKDEMETRFFVVIDAKHIDYFKPREPLFGIAVFEAFPGAGDDIEEAGKCLAFGRGTACAFHLMRAMEEALRTLAVRIGAEVYDEARGQFMPWGQIVGNVKDAIPKLPKDQQDDWTEAHNLLWGVNKSWRNKTMHPEKTYTDEQANAVFEAVRGFMRHLAPLVVIAVS
jgi:hypothetical protein